MAGPPQSSDPQQGVLVYLALGTNLGDRGANLRAALAAIARLGFIEAESRVYDTEPVGLRDQPAFWNLVVRARTMLLPMELLRGVKRIEQELGRAPAARNAPRIIDIDILAYDELVLQTSELELPHPRLSERTFVLYPLAEVAPAFRHPVDGRSIPEMIDALPERTRATPVERAPHEEN